MSKVTFQSLMMNLQMALGGVFRVLAKPPYAVLALAIATMFAILVYFIINIQFYGPFLISSLSFSEKVDTIARMISAMGGEMISSFNGMLLLTVSVLQGVALSVLVFSWRKNASQPSGTIGQAGSSGVAAVAAAIGLGCVPCGTSLLLPLVAIFFSGASAVAAANFATILVLLVALTLTVYSLYRSGIVAYAHHMSDGYDKKGGER